MRQYLYTIERSVAHASVDKALPYACAAVLVLVVAGPWLLPGFIFGTDWPGPRHFFLPHQVSSDAPFQVALVATGAVIGAELATKLIILGSLFLAALLAFKALPIGGRVPRGAAATIYTANPFVYGRLHYGQLLLIAAYALLPLFAITLRALVIKPGPRPAFGVAISLTLIGILDLHLLIPAGVPAIAVVVAFALARFREPWYVVRLAVTGIGSAALSALASAYWLIPLLASTNEQGQQVARFGTVDLRIFQTVPDPHLGLLPNVLGLYGFWAENVRRFPSMKDFVPLWPVVLTALLLLAALGLAATWLRPDRELPEAGPWIVALLAAGVVAVILDMGVAEPHIAPLIQWLDASFPPYRGMRDAGKWSALIALVYAQLVPLGAVAILGWLRRKPMPGRFEAIPTLAAALFIALPLYYGNGLLFGMHAQVRPSAYPVGWYAADRALSADRQPGTTLFLPWHLYLKFGFIQNTNAVIATPAPTFFSVPVLVSADAELPGLAPPNTPEQALVSRLVTARGDADWSQALATINIKYVLLARDVDWRDYQYLDHQAGLVKIGEYGSIVLYRNLSWRAP